MLQLVFNATARLVFSARRRDHVKLHRERHWLKVSERIAVSLCSGIPLPSYLAVTLPLMSDVESTRNLRCGSTSTLLMLSTRRTTRRFRWLQLGPGMHCGVCQNIYDVSGVSTRAENAVAVRGRQLLETTRHNHAMFALITQL